MTQKRIAELFGVGVPAISKHLDNIYSDGELLREATISILETVQLDGTRNVTRKVEYYNLDAVISVDYRVNSGQATQFRIWPTKLLKEYIIKGFALDDDRLKNGRYFSKDYFRELCWSACDPFVRVNGEFISRLQTFLLSAALIMIKIQRLLANFILMYKINFIFRLPARLLRNYLFQG